MKIKGLYSPGLAGVGMADSLFEAARVMALREVGSVAVQEEGRLVGILTEWDIVAAVAAEVPMSEATVFDHMSSEVQTADVQDESSAVAERMLAQGIRHLPVTDRGQVVGMISMRDLVALEAWRGSAAPREATPPSRVIDLVDAKAARGPLPRHR